MPSETAKAAAAVRADLKKAATRTALPEHPDGITFRVVSETAAVRVEAMNVPLAWAAPRVDGVGPRRPSQAWLALEEALLAVIARHYPEFPHAVLDYDTLIRGEG